MSVQPISTILEMTNEAWWNMKKSTFEAAWMICGYFSGEHFREFSSNSPVLTLPEARSVFDPSGTTGDCSFKPTPQMCTAYEWQLDIGGQDSLRKDCFEIHVSGMLSWMGGWSEIGTVLQPQVRENLHYDVFVLFNMAFLIATGRIRCETLETFVL